MKKSIIILLLVSLTAPFLGTYFFLQYNTNKIRKEIAGMILSGLDKKDIVLLKFTREETETRLSWKHSGEFEYNGQMYDIVDQSQEGDSVFYTCYKDHKETRLNAEKERIIAKAMGQDPFQKNQKERIKSFFKTIFQHEIFPWKSYLVQACIIHYTLNIKHYSIFLESPPSPPPKFV